MLVAVPLHAAPPAGFEAHAEELRKASGVPGMWIAIVEQGKPTLARGFGVRKLGEPAPVGPDTIFPTGSTGKAVTVAALATLVDAGKIGWDDKVVRPAARLSDVRRVGHARDDHPRPAGPSQRTRVGRGRSAVRPAHEHSPRRSRCKRLRYIKPATSFRSGYAYDNVLYMVAGQLIERSPARPGKITCASTCSPAGMLHSTTDETRASRLRTARIRTRAWTAACAASAIRKLLDERDVLGTHAAPAGGSRSARTTWHAGCGSSSRTASCRRRARLFSEAAHDRCGSRVLDADRPRGRRSRSRPSRCSTAYALGWDVRDYRGAKILWHGGAVFGFMTAVVLMPEKDVGFAICINSEDGEITRGLMFELLDHYLGLPHERLADQADRVQAEARRRKHCRRSNDAGANPRRSDLRCRSRATPAPTPIPGTATSKSP